MTASSTDNTQRQMHITIVGGGIAGLSTAWYVQKQADADGLPVKITVLEAGGRWGGKVLTDTIPTAGDPFIVEGGPDSFLTQKPWALQLARELGMEDRLLGTNDDKRKVYVVSNGKPEPLPDGVLLIVPTKFMPFALSRLISPLGKLRMGFDLFIPAKRDGEDETLAEFVRRRLGNEALDKIAEPLMSGIYNAEAERQSLLATFPRFRSLEEKHGSLIRGMIASRRARQSAPPPPNGKKAPALFTTFKAGTQELIDTLVTQLPCDLRLNTSVTAVTPQAEGGYALALGEGETLSADVVIMATPAFITADLVETLAPQAAESLRQIRYVSTGTVSLAYDQADVVDMPDGFGIIIPRSENRPINAVTVSSIKFDHRAPQGQVLIRVFFGGSRSPETMALSDDDLLATVRHELNTLLNITAEPALHRIYRWHRANPQYDVGHIDRVAHIVETLPEGLFVTGSPYKGVGLPDCVKQSQEIAAPVVNWLQMLCQPAAKEA